MVIAYAVFGTAWILAGNALLNRIDVDGSLAAVNHIEVGKGLLFVALSAGFIYLMHRAEISRKGKVQRRLGLAEYQLFAELRPEHLHFRGLPRTRDPCAH